MKTNSWFNQNHLLSPLRCATALLLVLSVLSISASSSQAGPAQTYQGKIPSGTFLCNGDASGFSPIVTGTWTLSIDPKTPAQVTLAVFYNGSLHVVFGYNALMQTSYIGGIYVFSGFGDTATATLNTTVTPAIFYWHVEQPQFNDCPPNHPYNSLTFIGVANH
jgi:hypothetical protein